MSSLSHTFRHSRLMALLAVVFVLVVLPAQAFAAELRNGTAVAVGPTETIDDDVLAGGRQTVTIAGHVTGDVYALAETVVVSGTIDGDLLAAGQTVVVDGTVKGNVRAAGGQVTINGVVGRSVTAAAQQVAVSSNGRVDGSVLAAGQRVDAFGSIGRGLTAGGGNLQLAGPVGGKVLANFASVTVAPTARLANGLDYHADAEAALPSDTVSGPVTFTIRTPDQAPTPAPLNGLLDVTGLIGLAGSAILGALAVVLMPRAAARALQAGRTEPVLSFGLGLPALILVPVLALVVAITLVGLPLSLTLVALYTLALLLAWPAVGLLVGTQLALLVRRQRPLPILATVALGLIVLHLATHLPFLGGLVAFLGLAFGLGLVIQSVRRWQVPPRQMPASVPLEVAA
jgi:cytoskeletal protein CcmA (bactofilin family)